MIWIAASAYFLLACAVGAFVLLSPVRVAVTQGWGRCHRWVGSATRRLNGAWRRRARQRFQGIGASGRDLWPWARRHALGLSGGAMLLVIPALLVFSLRSLHTLDAYDDRARPLAERVVVSSLLQGEQLVPPPPLPPEVFTTAEVENVRPELGQANRQWELLDAEFRQRLLGIYRAMKEEHQYDMVLIEGHRSAQRQDQLAAQGRHVTNAVAWQSQHQYGLAADSAFLRDGRLVIDARDAWARRGYALFGDATRRAGLVWGGGWQNRDVGHIELRRFSATRPQPGGRSDEPDR
jgi:peptidoglycan L-alanyl-D-glutamate endopeptidase CwlK